MNALSKDVKGYKGEGEREDGWKRKRGFLNEKYRVKLSSLRVLLPARGSSPSSPPWRASCGVPVAANSRIGFAASGGHPCLPLLLPLLRVDFFLGRQAGRQAGRSAGPAEMLLV